MPSPQKNESAFHWPEPIRWACQPLLRHLLLSLANYRITVEGNLPEEPAILAAYPHSEHIDALFLPPQNIVFIAAADLLYKNRLFQLGSSLLLDSLPVSRDDSAAAQLRRELAQQSEVLNRRQKHLLIYPQGSRLGPVGTEKELLDQLMGGVALMASHHQRPVVPIGYVYPEDYHPRKGGVSAGRRLVNRFHGQTLPQVEVLVRIGEPIEPPSDRSKRAKQLFLMTLARELFRLAEMLD